MSRTASFGVVLLLTPLLAQQPAPEEFRNPLNGQASAIEEGRQLFLKSCAGCHGPTGEGGRGPNLATGRQIRRANDRQLFASIKNGVAGTDMPPTPVDEDGVWRLVAYVRSLSAPAFEVPVPGDGAAGQAIYAGKGKCAGCHMINGRGGYLGPDLSNTGMALSWNQIRQAVSAPSERVASHQGVTAHLKSGRRVDGVLRDRTNYALIILDAQGNLHRIKTADIADYKIASRSLMPETQSLLTAGELRDLVRYLSRLSTRGAATE